MQKHSAFYSGCEHYAECFYIDFKATDINKIIKIGKRLHQSICDLEGYLGLDLIFQSDTQLMLLVKWATYTLFESNLGTLLSICSVRQLLKTAVQYSYQPVILKSLMQENECE